MQRNKVWFDSAGTRCAAWHYPGDNGACVVMAGGGGVTKEPGTDRFATRFQAEGFSVLAFDYRRLGESHGTPRQVIRVRDQLADWDAAIATARALPEVEPHRVAVWGFSLSGGHVFKVAARHDVAAAIAQTPTADGLAATPNALRHETLSVILRMPILALLDTVRGALGKPPLTVALAGPRGTVAMLTTPDAQDGARALDPDGRYPDWQQSIAARSVLPIAGYRPGRDARRVSAPLLVVVAERDQSALAAPARQAAKRATKGAILSVPGGHYAPFLDQHETVVKAELAFLKQHLTNDRSLEASASGGLASGKPCIQPTPGGG
jgi:pimeloyl-ACP methyl ester carboxylesterase